MITCDICPRRCELKDGEIGFCKARKNVDGKNIDVLYGVGCYERTVISGSRASNYPDLPCPRNGMFIHLFGCSLQCDFCAVPYLSKYCIEDVLKSDLFSQCFATLTDEHMDLRNFSVVNPRELTVSGGEASIHPEFISTLRQFCNRYNMRLNMPSNCYMTPQTAERLSSLVDTLVVGFKGSMNTQLYRDRLKADVESILNTVKIFWDKGTRLEIDDLVDPSLGDSEEDARKLGNWIVMELDPLIPVDIDCVHKIYDPSTIDGISIPQPYSNPQDTYDHILKIVKTFKDCGLRNISFSTLVPEKSGFMGGTEYKFEPIQYGRTLRRKISWETSNLHAKNACIPDLRISIPKQEYPTIAQRLEKGESEENS